MSWDSAGQVTVEAALGLPLTWRDREALVMAFVDVLRILERDPEHVGLRASRIIVDRRRRGPWHARVGRALEGEDEGTARLRDVRDWLVDSPPTPHTDDGRRACRARVAASTCDGPLSGASVGDAAATVDAVAAGALLWRVLAHPPAGSQAPPGHRSQFVDEASTVAAGLTHPLVRARWSPGEARRVLQAAIRDRTESPYHMFGLREGTWGSRPRKKLTDNYPWRSPASSSAGVNTV